ncbi:MAG: VanZ family protein [Gemmatimonadales bacterium]
MSVLAVLVATLHTSGELIAQGWSFNLTSGEGALAELIQNLLLFIPFGAAFAVAFPRRPFAAVLFGALLSFSVEFAQQWIPGRDPSVGDLVCNTVSTLLGAGLVRFAPRWLLVPPDRSAWQALGTAGIAVLAWLGTAAALRPTFPPAPYTVLYAPDFPRWGHYRGEIVSAVIDQGILAVTAVAPARPPGRRTPLAAVLDARGTRAVILAVDGHDLTMRYHMPAVELTLEQPDLRWPGALARIAPGETFTATTGHDPGKLCLSVNKEWRCDLGYTIGDGWKLIFFPEGWPSWLLTLINACWAAGCVVFVGFWAARTTPAVGGGKGRYAAVMAKTAVAVVILGLIVVPLVTDLKATTVWEWIGGLVGIEVGLILGNRPLKGRLGESARP